MNNFNIDHIRDYLIKLQDRIRNTFINTDPKLDITEDKWDKAGGSNGNTCVIHSGQFCERGGINFSHIHGENLPPSATAKKPELTGCAYQALGVSLVIHPLNPYIPTAHMNIRFFTTTSGSPIWWFGGGLDLTPYYGFREDAHHWHKTAQAACAGFGDQHTYSKYKQWCDDYFYLPHRQEQRGIGGIFFDDLNAWGFDSCFAFMRSVGDHFLKAYLPIFERRMHTPYSDKERDFQLYRRGRYVEFNLIYDRGTLFGLQSGGRTESILMSLPPLVRWQYSWQPKRGTAEAELYDVFLQPQDWLNP